MSLTIHTVIIAGAVYATLNAGQTDNSVKVYPELLKQAQIQGRVIVQAVIDTLGRAEPNTIKILQSPNPGFDQPSRNYVLKTLFRPARVHGRAVRVLINIPIDYKITQGR